MGAFWSEEAEHEIGGSIPVPGVEILRSGQCPKLSLGTSCDGSDPAQTSGG